MSHPQQPTDEQSEPPEGQLPPEFGLPIESLFHIDPLDLTSSDLSLLAQHYRNKRMMFQKMEEKPKSVERSRGPKLDPEASKAQINSILLSLVGGKKADD